MFDDKLSLPPWVEFLVIALLLGGAWFLRSKDLDRFKLTDETKWGFRSANFTLALHRGDYELTFQRSHPGVTTMWAGSIGMRFAIPDYTDRTDEYVENTSYKMDLRDSGLGVMQIIVPGRQVVIAVNLLILLVCFLYLRNLLSPLSAFAGLLLLAYEPFFIAHTRILHVDGFLSSFMYLSVIAYLSFLRNGKAFNLVLSGVAAGLTWLTKTPGFYLVAGVMLVAFVHWFLDGPGRSREEIWKSALKAGWHVMLWGLVGAIVMIIVWPAMWVQPLAIIKQLLRESLDYAIQGHTSPVVFNGIIYRDGIVPRSIWYYYPLTYLWRASPIVLLGLLFALIASIFRLDRMKDRSTRNLVLSLVLFAAGFMLFMSIGSKRSDRYVLPTFPPLAIVAGLGWMSLLRGVQSLKLTRVWKQVLVGIVPIAFMLQIVLPILYRPYYLSYFNPLMGGYRKAPDVLQVGWGEGLDEAARYLNEMPGAEAMVVASWYERVFSEFFVGKTINIEDQPQISQGEIEHILGADYIVIYYHQFQRAMPENLLVILQDQTPIHRFWFNNLEYIRIYDPSTFTSPELIP
jgi:hypothetical protein